MTLNELKSKCDIYIDLGHGHDDVLINVQHKSVGQRASTNIDSISPGIDWESDQIRIEPTHKLTYVETGRDVPAKPYRVATDIRTVIKCGKCGNKLRKADKFCPDCGQKILKGEYIDVNLGKGTIKY